MKSCGKIWLALSVMAMAAGMQADTLHFKSGDKLTGKVKTITSGSIVFDSDAVGVVTVDSSKLSSVETEGKQDFQFVDNHREQIRVGMKDDVYSEVGDDGKPLRTIDMSQVKAVNPAEETWHGNINIGATATRGNTRSEKASVVAGINRRWEHDRFAMSGGYFAAQSGTVDSKKEKTEDRMYLQAQEDHFFTDKFYGYVNGRFDRDQINNLSRRYRIGAGIGYQWLDGQQFDLTGKWSFSQELGGEYVNERWGNKTDYDEDYMSLRYAHHLNWVPVWINSVECFHNLEYHPQVDDWQDTYFITADAGFTTVIWAGWNLLAKVEWDYNSSPSASAKSSDFRYILALGYKW